MRNENECVCSAHNCYDTEQRSASQPGSVARGTHRTICNCVGAQHGLNVGHNTGNLSNLELGQVKKQSGRILEIILVK